MKKFFTSVRTPCWLVMTLLGTVGGRSSALAQPVETLPIPAIQQPTEQLFTTPAAAIQALQTATAAGDKTALRNLFGRQVFDLMTGDDVQDANNAKRFATAMTQSCTPVPEGADKITLEVGTNNWPLPIPLVRTDGQWHFDTTTGKEEIIYRHIGKDELHAIGVCREYVTAQQQFASMNLSARGEVAYALKFKSSAGKQDGLYWPTVTNEPASPFGPLVARAYAQGYFWHRDGAPQPFHGYYFQILTRQGPAAPGGSMSYLQHGQLTEGFALIAYPVSWDQSGIMTFIVNQTGAVYQQNLGEKTTKLAQSIKTYDPDSNWTLVPDEGVRDAAWEK